MKKSGTTSVSDHRVEKLVVSRDKFRPAAGKALTETNFAKSPPLAKSQPVAEDFHEPANAHRGSLPKAAYSPGAEQSLTVFERVLLDEYLIKLEQACINIPTNVTKITVDIPPDPEEAVRRIVVTSHFDVDAETAFSYWDIIGKEFYPCATGSDDRTAADVPAPISTSVRWRYR